MPTPFMTNSRARWWLWTGLVLCAIGVLALAVNRPRHVKNSWEGDLTAIGALVAFAGLLLWLVGRAQTHEGERRQRAGSQRR